MLTVAKFIKISSPVFPIPKQGATWLLQSHQAELGEEHWVCINGSMQ